MENDCISIHLLMTIHQREEIILTRNIKIYGMKKNSIQKKVNIRGM